DKDDLSASIHNPNNSQRNQTRNQNQGQNHNQNQNCRHNIGNNQMSVVEKAILESLDSMHDKFDDIARRVTALECKFADMDAFLENNFPQTMNLSFKLVKSTRLIIIIHRTIGTHLKIITI